jgi:hypothetical protein
MANTTENLECYSPAQAEMLAREILDPNLDIGRLRQQAERLLATDNPLRIFENLTQGGRENLVNRVDQVRRPGCRLSSATLYSHCIYKGIPGGRHTECGVFDSLRQNLRRY